MKLRAVFEYDDIVEQWAVYCPECAGLTSCGTTEEEAKKNFEEAVSLYFQIQDIALPENSKVLEMVV